MAKDIDQDLLKKAAQIGFSNSQVLEQEETGAIVEQMIRTSFDISKSKHQKLKIFLAMNNLTLKDYLLAKIDEAIKNIE